MAAIRGTTGPTAAASSLAWPAGTAVGDLAVLWDAGGKRPAGWSTAYSDKTLVYTKRLVAGDFAAAQPVTGAVSTLFVLSAGGGIGKTSYSKYCTTKATGVALWLGWKTPYSSSALAAATYQVGSTVVHPTDSYRYAAYARATASAGSYEPGSVHDRTNMVSIEIVPLAAPTAPTWTSPQSGVAVDRTQAQTVVVAHQSAAAATQDRLRVEIRVAAGTWQHVAADGTLQATAQELVQDHGSVTIAANQLAVNTTYELRAYTHDDGGWSPTSASLSLVARTPPAVAVALTTAAEDLSPTVSWTTTPGLGAQTSWEVRIAPAGAGADAPLPAWVTGVQSGTDTSWTAPASTEPTNGASYVAWMRVTDGALRSAWTASTAKTVSWTPPAAPSACTAADGTPPTITATGVPAGSVKLEWEWLVDSVWLPLTTTASPTETTAIRPAHAPYGVAHTYRVRALAVVDGVTLASAWVTSSAMTSTDRGAYILSADGSEWLAVTLARAGAMVPIQAVSVTTTLGGVSERVDRSPVTGWRSWWVVRTLTLADEDTLLSWLTSGARPTLRLRPNPERPFTGAHVNVPSLLVAVRNVPEPDRLIQRDISARHVAFEWTKQGA